MMKKICKTAAIAILGIVLYTCRNHEVLLSGAGATFPVPYYELAFKTFQEKNPVKITYTGIGSSAGIHSIENELVDFAGSDMYSSSAQKTKEILSIPSCLGAVVISYNLQEVKTLNLTADIICNIYSGKITQWNDPEIKAVNPQTILPDKKIVPVYRSDDSGTTYVFTDYLSKTSKIWKEYYGRHKTLQNSQHKIKGIAAKGNQGVTGIIRQTEGAFGYTGAEYAYAQYNQIAYIQNASGYFVGPSAKAVSAAAKDFSPNDTDFMITNASAKEAYPISCISWILVYREQSYAGRSRKQAAATINMLRFLLSDTAQALTEKVNYAPLPANIMANAKKNLSKISYKGEPEPSIQNESCTIK